MSNKEVPGHIIKFDNFSIFLYFDVSIIRNKRSRRMATALLWILAIAAGVILIPLMMKGNPRPLQFHELSSLLDNADSFEYLPIERKNADFAIQIRNEEVSIKYFRSQHDTRVETLDIFAPGTAGMILTFYDDKLVEFSRIGGIPLRGEAIEYISFGGRFYASSFVRDVRNIVISHETAN